MARNQPEDLGDQQDSDSPFAFQDIDYIPFGYGGVHAPYIESGQSTMRAAVKLMGLDQPRPSDSSPAVVADLGCGDGEFLIGMISHINNLAPRTPAAAAAQASGVGVDYDANLIAAASAKAAALTSQTFDWSVYDFNLDQDDLVAQFQARGVTHLFAYLIPKQLALKTVRRILQTLVDGGVVVCCYKFHPDYMRATRRDSIMNLEVYDKR